MGMIRHIAITAEDPFATAELFKRAFGLEELHRGDSDMAREVYLTDGHINLAVVCWKRTPENPVPYPEGYGLDHFGFQVDDLEAARKRIEAAGGKFFLTLGDTKEAANFEMKFKDPEGVIFDISEKGWVGTKK